MAHAHFMLDTYGHKQALRMCSKGKAVPLRAWTDPEGSRKLMFPDFVTAAQDTIL
jgi:hypothetical protein